MLITMDSDMKYIVFRQWTEDKDIVVGDYIKFNSTHDLSIDRLGSRRVTGIDQYNYITDRFVTRPGSIKEFERIRKEDAVKMGPLKMYAPKVDAIHKDPRYWMYPTYDADDLEEVGVVTEEALNYVQDFQQFKSSEVFIDNGTIKIAKILGPCGHFH